LQFFCKKLQVIGLAAVQIAQWVGAEIWATAGSSEKREFLQSLGIDRLMDSRTLDFADEVRQRTDGKGVDKETLDRVRSLLVPGGFLLLWETTQTTLEAEVIDALIMKPIEDETGKRNMGNPC
jgi:NADPH:quinone reductase-like Zn-dependent oxidoreductase